MQWKRNFPSTSTVSTLWDSPWAVWVFRPRCSLIRKSGRLPSLCRLTTNFSNAAVITRIPLWVFQGDADQTVPVDLVREMMKQLTKLRANLRYTEYHKADHEVWNRAFAEPDLLPWLSIQTRGQRTPSVQGQLGSTTSLVDH
jgi:hypothetical protein